MGSTGDQNTVRSQHKATQLGADGHVTHTGRNQHLFIGLAHTLADDGDVKIADGRIPVPDKTESPIDLSRQSSEPSAEETGTEIENSTGD